MVHFPGTGGRSRLRRWALSLAVPFGLALVIATPVSASASSYSYTGVWNGYVNPLTHVANVTVEGLPDASLVGTISNFQTNDPAYSCLNGETINVFTAPSEFPNEYVVHNGLQGSQCTYGTWTFPEPTYYTVTLSAWIPQTTLDGAPLLSWTDYAAIGDSCWTPPWYDAPFTDEILVGQGDSHVGYNGSVRAYVRAEIGWNGYTITNFIPEASYVTTSEATAYYLLGPDLIHTCTVLKLGTQESPTPAQTGSDSFTLQVKAANNVAPPPLNPPFDGAITVTVSGNASNPNFSFGGGTNFFPSYGVGVSGPYGTASDVLYSVSGYGSTISYEQVATLLGICTLCNPVSGGFTY